MEGLYSNLLLSLSLSLLPELESSGDRTNLSDIPVTRKPKRGAEIRRRRVSKSRGSPYRTSQGSSGHEDVDGHPPTLSPMAMGGVAFSTATATTTTTDGGVIVDKPATGSPEHCTSDEGKPTNYLYRELGSNLKPWRAVKLQFYVCDKFMWICHNGPLDELFYAL